jgi:hypothetical protein
MVFSDFDDSRKRRQGYLQQVPARILKCCEEISEKGLGDWKPFKIANPQDIKSSQLCLTHGAANGMHFFYHLCQLHSDDIAITNQVPCCSGYGPNKALL